MIVDVEITAAFDGGATELVYDTDLGGFQPAYVGSTEDITVGGSDLNLRRVDGWPGTSIELTIVVEDDLGNVTTEVITWQLPAPVVTIEPGTATGADAAAGRVGQFDVRFDPVTGDWIDDGAGAVQMVTTAETSVLLQLVTHHGRWGGDPDAGSRIHDLDQFTTDPEALIADEARRALDVLVADGEIADIDVTVTETAPGRVEVATSFRDVKTGSTVVLAIPASGV